MFCPKCGTQNPDDSGVCHKCGTALQSVKPTETPVTPGQNMLDGEGKPLKTSGFPSILASLWVVYAVVFALEFFSGGDIGPTVRYIGIGLLIITFIGSVINVITSIVSKAMNHMKLIFGIAGIAIAVVAAIVVFPSIGDSEDGGSDYTGGYNNVDNIGSNQQPTGSISGDRIVIGKTRTYDNASLAGVVEVTLEYAEFENRAPDSGYTYLRIEYAVKNIGTVVSSFMPGIGTLLYNDVDVFECYETVPVLSLNQEPLSSAEKATAYYIVPNSVVESGKSLVLRFGNADWNGVYIEDMSFTIRPSADASAGQQLQGGYLGELFYDGIPVIQVLYGTADEVKALYGTPVDEGIYAVGYCLGYEGITFILNYYNGTDTVLEIWITTPSVATVDGITLDKNRDELVGILGDPAWEGWANDTDVDTYLVQYNDSCLISFAMDDPDETAYLIAVR